MEYFRCVAGVQHKMNCGDDRTVFDVSQSACVWRSEVPECEGKPSETKKSPEVEDIYQKPPKDEEYHQKSPEAKEAGQESPQDETAYH